MKRAVSIFLSFALILTTAGFAFAADYSVGEEYAAYISGGYYGHNTFFVNGSMYSADGDVNFEPTGAESIVNGNVYYNTANNFSSGITFNGTATPLDNTEFNAQPVPAIDAPSIDNYSNSFTAGWWPEPDPITQDTHFGVLSVENVLTVDVSNGDITIVADTLNMPGNGKIKLSGDGSLYLFINSDFSISGSNTINVDGSRDKVYIILPDGKFSMSGSAQI
ncbi:MAG: hypothetical protein GX541_03095, partial [Clostridiales bacterium]|nr:hypothetical protein [Clostridiales bacterium]